MALSDMKGDCPILYLCNPSFNHSNHFLVVKNTGIEKVMNQMLDWEMLLKKVNKWVKSDKIKAEKKRKADVRAEKSGRPKQAAAGSNTNYKWQKNSANSGFVGRRSTTRKGSTTGEAILVLKEGSTDPAIVDNCFLVLPCLCIHHIPSSQRIHPRNSGGFDCESPDRDQRPPRYHNCRQQADPRDSQ